MSKSQTIRMLSIEDKSVTTDLDRAGYRKMGVEVRSASGYDQAEKILQSESVDIVVVNADFPHKINAPAICKHLKAQQSWVHIPVVITTVIGSAEVRKASLAAGTDLFVVQPIPRQNFIEKLKGLLDQSTRTDERVELPGDARFEIEGRQGSCPVVDLSLSGILLSTGEELPSGTEVHLKFEVPGSKKAISARGQVVRIIKNVAPDATHPICVGVRFQTFDGDSQKRLEKYISKSSHQASRMIYYL